MIRDQLVEKTTSTKLRERLLLEKDLTLTKAITLARNMEQALREASSMCPNGKPISTAEVRKKGVQPPSSAGTKRQCYRCGSNKHLANSRDCKAVDAVCRGCNKKGHFEKMCRQRKVRAIGENLPTAAPTNHPAVSPSFNQADNEPQVLQTVNNGEHDTKVRPNVSCILNFNGADIPVVVDTASDVTLMNIDTFDLYFVREALQPCTTSITSYTSNKIPLLGYFDTNVSFQERSARIRTYVTRQGSTLVGYGIGAIMTQMIDGQERIVSCISRKLSEAERKYSTGEREALACVWAIERWHTYLWGRHFTLRTDHQALVTLLSTSGTGHRPMRIARWGSRLLHYNFTVEYKPGNQNKISDALSRLPLDSDNLQLQIDEDVHAVCEIVLNDSCITKEQLREATNADVLLKEVSKYIISGWPKKSSDVSAEILPYFRIRDSLSIHHDIVFKGERVVIPSELVKRIIQFGHEGHQGIVRTKQRLRQLYWWPNMDDVIMQTIKDCTVCQNHDKTARVRTAPMQPVPLPTSSWKKLAIDIVGPDSTAPRDCRFAITLIDYYSKWPEVAFCHQVTAHDVIDVLTTIFSREGFPEEIVTDNGPQFTCNEFETYLQERNIKHRFSAIYHPQGNSEIERFNRVLNDSVQTAKLTRRNLKLATREFLAVYRSTPHATTGVEPSILLHGRHLKTKLDITGVTTSPTSVSPHALRQKVQRKQEASKEYFDKRKGVVQQDIQPGSWVRVRKPGNIQKGCPKFSEPIQITKKIAPNTYETSDGRQWNVERLAPYNGNPQPQGDLDPSQIPPQGQESQENRPDPNTNARPQRIRSMPYWAKDFVFY
ncbi:hypothetical protein HOLleu_43793 [Holothuria leucospilota]|uniref:Integrase catalytic domain-containing protein n=1 Tax=Holothuria leucospilota TaxID=206669 RepID=A0A9Q1B8X2_HOLLE|nr:hypothetical protein HOLleu_43793 [Holothuria leucospilota]